MHAGEQERTVSEKLYLTDDGLQFDNSILWLDSRKNGKLSFLSSAGLVRERHDSQLIVSEETYKLLKLYNPNVKALVCQYNRPFSIGRYDLELLPSGSALGASSLYIDTGSEKILYAPALSDSKMSLARSTQYKDIDYLILRVDHCDSLRPLLAKRKEELNRLVFAIKNCLKENKIPVVLSPLLHTASEISSLFSEEGIRVLAHKHIFEINQVYESFGHKIGDYSLLNLAKKDINGALLVPLSFRSKKLLLPAKSHEIFFINDKLDSSYSQNSPNTFNIPLPEMNINLSKTIKELKPKKTFLFGPYATRFASLNKSVGFPLEVVHPFHQVSLL